MVNHIPLPRENIYGHTEKLRFFLSALARLRAERGRGLRILDIGCGNGWAVTRHLGEPGDEILGIDMHAPSIDYAQSNFTRHGLDFRCVSAESLYNIPKKWDVIVLADVLEHVEDPKEILSICSKLLTSDGQLLVALPNGRGPFELESALARMPIIGPILLRITDYGVAVLNKYVFRGLWTRALQNVPLDIPYNHDSPHVHFKTRRAWLNLCSHAGYRLIDERNLSFLSGPFSNYLLGASRGFCSFNVRIASRLPPAIVSNWSFVIQKKNHDNK
jgi:2-polyprenyl-3-methyl-5-hydroxy-6-metoxy-1,4-benzoquinol methylase